MIKTKHLLRLVKAAHKIDIPAAVSSLGDKGGWCPVPDYEAYCAQVSELKLALELLQNDPEKPKKKPKKKGKKK